MEWNNQIICFDGIKKPNGVEFMYNETTLTESPFKREKVEEVFNKIVDTNPSLIDRFGDQMHLSDEDVMTEVGRRNLQETAQLLKRIQDKKIYVNEKEKYIKTECTEHDFHFSKPFLENVEKLKQDGKNVDLWHIKRTMQNYISKTYTSNGVNFERSTYWSLFGKNDHNLVRTNQSIAEKNKKRNEMGKSKISLINSMSSGIIKDGKTFSNVKSLKKDNKNSTMQNQQQSNHSNQKMTHNEIKKPFARRSQSEIQIANQIKQKNEIIKQRKEQKRQMNKPKVKTLTSSSQSKGFANTLVLSLIASFVVGALFMVVYMIIGK